jgi:virulence factor Mce-like protein
MAGTARGERPDSYFVLHGLLVLAVAAALVGLTTLSVRGTFTNTRHVSALMSDVGGGLESGSDVKLRGLVVGRVTEVSGTPGRVLLDIAMDDDELDDIPADVQARVLPASVFGTSYLELTSPSRGGSGDSLYAGARIPQDLSKPTIELQRALDSIDGLVKALGPADLAVVLHAIAGSLDGRGHDIGTMLDRLDHLLSVVNPRMPLMRADLELLVRNTDTVRKIAPDLLDSLASTASVAQGIVVHQDDLRRLLAAAIDLVNDGNDFLDATEAQYVRAILQTAGVTDAVFDNRDGVGRQIRALDHLLTQVLTVTDGGAVRIDIRLVAPGPHHYYTAADCPRYGSDAGTNCRG